MDILEKVTIEIPCAACGGHYEVIDARTHVAGEGWKNDGDEYFDLLPNI